MNHLTLAEKAQDFQAPILDRKELNELWEQANSSMHSGAYQSAFSATEGLLCQAERGNVCADELAEPQKTKVGEGRSLEMIQGFIDRVESLNHYVRFAKRDRLFDDSCLDLM